MTYQKLAETVVILLAAEASICNYPHPIRIKIKERDDGSIKSIRSIRTINGITNMKVKIKFQKDGRTVLISDAFSEVEASVYFESNGKISTSYKDARCIEETFELTNELFVGLSLVLKYFLINGLQKGATYSLTQNSLKDECSRSKF